MHELRRHSLHACKSVQYVREEYGPALAQRHGAETLALLKSTAADLDTRLAG